MTVIETSKLLLECADWHDSYAFKLRLASMPGTGEIHEQWAEALRNIAIPAPLGSDDETP